LRQIWRATEARTQKAVARVDLTEAIGIVSALRQEAEDSTQRVTEHRAQLDELQTALSATQSQLQAIVANVQPKGARTAWWFGLVGMVAGLVGIAFAVATIIFGWVRAEEPLVLS
jgi:hypothetical protein